MHKIIMGLLAATALVLAGCTSLPVESFDGNWSLTSATDAQGTLVDGVDGGTLVTIDGDEISGQICNNWGGNIAIDGSSVVISSVYSTKMACNKPDGIMDFEMRFLNDLSLITSIELVDGGLRLMSDAVTLDFAASE
jgi:heat shock protein HslJ